jgi:inner membrane protein
MATAFSHAVAALGIGACFYRPEVPKRVWVAGAVCAALPDLDVIGFRFGVHYGDFCGHRGFTHSLVFAVLLAAATVLLLFSRGVPGISRFALTVYLFLATASHGFLDAMTNGGLGVAFFSPLDNRRYFLPWRPIAVAPISIGRFFTARGLGIMQNEFLWIWIPTMAFAASVWMLRRYSLEPTPPFRRFDRP